MWRNCQLCGWCGLGCIDPCQPVKRILSIYEKERTEDKKELLKILKSELDIIDYEPSQELEILSGKVQDKIPELSYIREYEVKVGYVLSSYRKIDDGELVFVDCRKVTGPMQAYLPYQVIITFYEPNIDDFTPNQKAVLMWHELKHIELTQKGIKIKNHDVRDFRSIIDRLGLDWSSEIEIEDILGG